MRTQRPTAIVMNMFYTGLGIARSLGEHNIPVLGLTSERGVYGNFTRYAKTVVAPDSRREPEALREWLLAWGKQFRHRAVIFPTRDDDVVFLDRFREELAPYFIPVVASREAVRISLDKWLTFLYAQKADVATPACWVVESEEELKAALFQIRFPCVLKPVAAYHWHASNNWEVVGGRKVICVENEQELLFEYRSVSRANGRALIQEMVPGGDDNLAIQACYMDRSGRCIAAFNTKKLIQIPQGFGTGCIVAGSEFPDLLDRTIHLLQTVGYSGVAEVEYKLDPRDGQYKLIEINPRPWDQHRLGNACGVDLMYTAYCDVTGLPIPGFRERSTENKWIAEDAFIMAALRTVWRREAGIGALFRMAAGKRIYGIWSPRDPLPFVAYLLLYLVPQFARAGRDLFQRIVQRHDRRRTAAETEPARL